MTDSPTMRRVERALADLDADKRPRADWQKRVLAATRIPRRPIVSSWSVTVLAAAAVLIVWLVVNRPRSAPSVLAVATAIQPPATKTRGHSANIGDLLKAAVAGGPHLALWIYRGDELVLACPGTSQCAERDKMVEATLELKTIGKYSVVALSSAKPIPPPQGVMDSDVATALDSGAERRIEETIVQ
jgi:hypothetical protein